MFHFGNVPHGTHPTLPRACGRCNHGLVSPADVFVDHCDRCLAELAAESEADLGDGGPVQGLLASHRAFGDWLRAHGTSGA
jgi:hypothetical protein